MFGIKILTQSLRRLLSLGEFILPISPREMFMLLLVLFMVYLNNSFQMSLFHEVAISMAKEPIPGKPAMMTGMEEMTSQGFYIGCAKNVHFDRLELVDVEHAFHIENS